MRLTTKSRFAVTALLDVAMREHEGSVSLASISERQQISSAYLEQLFGKLKRAGLVSGCRGASGGYTLARAPNEVSVAQIIHAVDEMLDSTQCSGREDCRHVDDQGLIRTRCMTHRLWERLNAHVLSFLSGISLADLMAQQKENCDKSEMAPLHDLRQLSDKLNEKKSGAVELN